jgi:hypothetical protein
VRACVRVRVRVRVRVCLFVRHKQHAVLLVCGVFVCVCVHGLESKPL